MEVAVTHNPHCHSGCVVAAPPHPLTENEPRMKRFDEEMSEISSKQDLKKSGGLWRLYLDNGWTDFDNYRLDEKR
jgi:hypothetical protein